MAMGCCASKVLQSAFSLKVGDGDPCGSKDTMVVDVLETVEASENCHVGIRAFPLKCGKITTPNEDHLQSLQ